ncbi:hypothetical protein JW823_10315 [bacterium]|nr:hypothetical protein [candidate division CSSED10-310 bacterium]
MRMLFNSICFLAILIISVSPVCWGIDLATIYPPSSEYDSNVKQAYAWEFTENDIYRLKNFHFKVADKLDVSTEDAFVGVGHCEQGAVWAVVIPDSPGMIGGSAIDKSMNVAHIWLRFNPGEINRLFLPKTVAKARKTGLQSEMDRIAKFKITSSWHSGGRAFLPPPGNITLDIRNDEDGRRFFAINTVDETVELIPGFNERILKAPVTLTQQEALDHFHTFWSTYDTQYPGFYIRPDIDWNGLKNRYYPKFSMCRNSSEFALMAADLLSNLKDRHIWLYEGNMPIPVYTPDIEMHVNRDTLASEFSDLQNTASGVTWGVSSDHIGYIMIPEWRGSALADDLDVILEQMRNTRGLIVDVRLNGGGSEPIARDFAGRFLANSHVYAYSVYKKGEAHDDLTEKQPRTVSPRGPWQYSRPVILLIDQPCLSSNESFICMLKGSDAVTSMGYRTGGSSGNPRFEQLPCGISFTIPQWIDYLPDGTLLELHGIIPDVLCDFPVDAFITDDPVLKSALKRLGQQPLPAIPIAGPAVGVADRPRVIDVFPANGALIDPGKTTLRIRFDRPMNPDMGTIFFQSGGCIPLGQMTYDPAGNEFSVPLKFFPGVMQEVSIASSKRQSFMDQNGTGTESYNWTFTVNNSVVTDRPIPKLTTVIPGAEEELGWITIFNVTFDGPMDPDSMIVSDSMGPPGRGDYSIIPSIEYDSETFSFRVPIVMKKDWSGTVTLQGFRDTTGRLTDKVEIPARTGDTLFQEADMQRFLMTSDPEKLRLLEQQILSKRRAITSFIENVTDTTAFGAEIQGYRFINKGIVTFAVEPGKCFAEAGSLRMGFDSKDWWVEFKQPNNGKSTFQWVSRDNDVIWTVFSDPLYILTDSYKHGENKPHLEYLGLSAENGTSLHRFRRWTIIRYPDRNLVIISEFGINADTGLLESMSLHSNIGMNSEKMVEYLHVNEKIDANIFNLATYTQTKPETDFPFRDPADAESVEQYFYLIDDGSSSNTQVRFGYVDPTGKKISSGHGDFN